MSCSNREKVEVWFKTMTHENVSIRRYHAVPVGLIESTNTEQWMIGHLDHWLETGDYITFWHLKQLIIHFKNTESKIPIVATYLHNRMFVDPGLSRLAVLKFLGKPHIDVDVVYPDQQMKDTEVLGSFVKVGDVNQLLAPYDSMGVDYRLDTCYASPCKTCLDNKVIHNGNFRYSPEWQSKWFYDNSFEEWYSKTRDIIVKDKMEWYHI